MESTYYRNRKIAAIAIDALIQKNVLPEAIEISKLEGGTFNFDLFEAYLDEIKSIHKDLQRRIECLEEQIEIEEQE